jgi:hypothetical protein
LALILGFAAVGSASTFQTLYSFTGADGDGSFPSGSLVADSNGVLYGTTQSGGAVTGKCGFPSTGGTVYSLSPPSTAAGGWTEKILYAFTGSQGDCDPVSGVILGPDGTLYGTAANGSSLSSPHGVVFALIPPKVLGAPWQETILHSFADNGDGAYPFGGLARDRAGVLYGTTQGFFNPAFGNAFSLTPPRESGKSWTYKTLHDFDQTEGGVPQFGLVRGPNNQLFGITASLIYSLSAPTSPGGSWNLTTISSHSANAITFDRNGNLYGALSLGPGDVTGCATNCHGEVFELSPPLGQMGAWAETDLHTFTGIGDGAGPDDLVVVPTGVIGTTEGTIWDPYKGFVGLTSLFALKPPASPGSPWDKGVLAPFASGAFPLGLFYVRGTIYGTTGAGGDNNAGTVFMWQP